MSETPVSPTPWYSEPCFDERKNGTKCWCACVVTKLGSEDLNDCVIPYGNVTAADAALIVAAVNAYEPLKAVAEAARNLAESRWEHRCNDKVGGCTAVSASKLARLDASLAALPGGEI